MAKHTRPHSVPRQLAEFARLMNENHYFQPSAATAAAPVAAMSAVANTSSPAAGLSTVPPPPPPLYVASAIFDPSTGAVDRLRYAKVGEWLERAARGAAIFNQQLVMHAASAALAAERVDALFPLNPEQQALLDFLVLLRADKVGGGGHLGRGSRGRAGDPLPPPPVMESLDARCPQTRF